MGWTVWIRFPAGARFFSSQRPDRLWGPPYPVRTAANFPAVKRSGREADHSPPYSAEVRDGGSVLHASICRHGVLLVLNSLSTGTSLPVHFTTLLLSLRPLVLLPDSEIISRIAQLICILKFSQFIRCILRVYEYLVLNIYQDFSKEERTLHSLAKLVLRLTMDISVLFSYSPTGYLMPLFSSRHFSIEQFYAVTSRFSVSFLCLPPYCSQLIF
jgi:hypothetical protein